MKSLYLQIADTLHARRDELQVPLALPDERALAAEFSVARETIRRALTVLEEQAAVTRKPGIGTYLQPRKAQPTGLRGKRIGFVPPWWAETPNSWYYNTILDGVSRWTEENDCAFTVLHAAAQPLHDHQWLERIRRLELSGIIWVQPQEAQHSLLFKTAQLFPTIILGRSIAGKGLHHVIPDYAHAAELIDAHLVAHGHSEYGVVGKNVFDPYSQVWIESFRRAHAKRGSKFQRRPHYFDYDCFGQERLASLLLDFFLPEHPELQALVFPSSGYLRSLQKDARFCERLKSGLSIVTTNYGSDPIESVLPEHRLTHITCDWSRMARRTLDALALLAENHQVPENIHEEVSLVIGETVHQRQETAAA